MSIHLTLHNYRCFADDEPLRFTLAPGFTAIVGPNNSGKSSLLRFFHESRYLWELCQIGNFYGLIVGQPQRVNPRDVLDQAELFCNRNQRNLRITIEIDVTDDETGVPPLRQVTFATTRGEPSEVRLAPADGFPLRSDPKVPFDVQGDIVHYGGSRVKSIGAMKAAMKSLQQSIYIGPFRNILTAQEQPYYDLPVAGSFIRMWHEWKSGKDKAKSRTIHRVTEDLKGIFSFKSLEINAADDIKSLHVVRDGWSYRLEELGAGLAQFIYVLGTAAMKRPTYIFIDEPELHLHPSLQLDFLTRLAAHASEGIVFSTHSIGLARAAADRVSSVRLLDGNPVCRPLEETPGYAEFLGEMSFASYREIGVESVLLVEGITEVRTIQQFLRRLHIEHRILILPLGGSQMIKAGVDMEVAEIGRIAPRVFVLIDSERSGPDVALDPQRQAFVSTCERLGYKIHVTAWRALENYFTDAAIKAQLGEKYKSLEPFETLRNASLGWAKADNWRIAQHMSTDELLACDVGRFLHDVVRVALN
jgi:hypothetical protein